MDVLDDWLEGETRTQNGAGESGAALCNGLRKEALRDNWEGAGAAVC